MKRPIHVFVVAAALLVSVAGCAPKQSTPPTHHSGSALTCSRGDHALTESEAGWSFCYPATWRFIERVQPSDQPYGEDATFDITDDAPLGDPSRGLFGYMIVSTYSRGGSPTLADWLQANVGQQTQSEPIVWGNASDAVLVAANGTRYALTPHHVVALQLRSGADNLDLGSQMGSRLSTWRFSY